MVDVCLAVDGYNLEVLFKARDVTVFEVVAVVTAFLLSNLEKTGFRARILFVTGVWFLTEFVTLLFFSDSESDSDPRFLANFSDTARRWFSFPSDSSAELSPVLSDSSESLSALLDDCFSSFASWFDSCIRGSLGVCTAILSAKAFRSWVTSVFDSPVSLIRVIERLLKTKCRCF